MKNVVGILCAVLLLFMGCDTSAAESETQKAVLITGATTGIGRVAAEHLAANGYFVYAGARKASDIEELNKIDNIQAVRLDVTIQEEIDAAVEHIRTEGRGLWGLVNNAGVNVVGPLIEFDDEDFDFLFDVNVKGVFSVTKAFAPLIIESRGRIVNISSVSGIGTGAAYGPYSMTKHAIEAFTDALKEELEVTGVLVAGVEPGNYSSAIGLTRCKRMLAKADAGASQYWEDLMKDHIDYCKERISPDYKSSAPEPVAVAAAVEHALFAAEPRAKYLVTPSRGAAGWITWSLVADLLDYNTDAEYGFSRDEIIDLLDREIAFRAGDETAFDDLIDE
jgi:NAD(P)-dependent dehydrogenase (short-subunit alcohol dehydrogenase family)